MRYKLLFIAMSVFLVVLSIFNQSCESEDKVKEIDKFMTKCYENDLFNGTVLIAHDGKVLYKNAFGYSNLETKEALKLNTRFYIASVSKQFTSMAIMILKEQNKLDYENKLADYFHKIPYANKITIRHLLTHTSGLPRWSNSRRFTLDGLTNEKVFESLVQLDSLEFKPGEKYSYSNSGYVLLAMIVEKVSGISYHDFMKQYIFDPIDMKNTFVRNKLRYEIPKRAIGFNQYGDKYDDNAFSYGHGGIYSTVEDLFRWDQSLYTEKLIAKETLKEAFAPGLLNNGTPSRILSDSTWGYGFGWLLRKNNSDNIVWHDGGYNGFSAILYRELNRGDCIILLSNKGEMGINAPVYPIQRVILKILNGELYEFPQIPIVIKMRNTIENNNLEAAINEYHELKKTYADKYDFSENQLNSLGYYYLNKQQFNEAKAILGLNIKVFPNSSNVYDSYGEACMLNSDYDEAIWNYKRSLELNPDNANATEMLKKINEKMMNIEK